MGKYATREATLSLSSLMASEITLTPGNSWLYDPCLAVASRRRYSSILTSFPWQWEGIVSVPQGLEAFCEKLPEYKHFIRSLHEFESRMLSLGSGQTSSDVLTLLGVQIKYQQSSLQPVILSTHKDELTPVEFQSIASVIAAYSLFEILALRSNLVSRIPFLTPSPSLYLPPSRTKVQQQLQGMESINDWFDILFNFRKVMNKLKNTSNKAEIFTTGHPLVSLLRMVARSNTNNDYFRVENNVLHAALHINTMNSVVFSPDQVPDLPRDVHRSKYPIHIDAGLVQDVYSQDTTVLDAVAEDPLILAEIQGAAALSNIGPGMLRNAFHMAAILSPIPLLRSKQLVKISLHRRTLLELAATLRPQKTELLLRVEDKIWGALLALARGRATPLAVLQHLAEEIPWDELEAAIALAQGYQMETLESFPHDHLALIAPASHLSGLPPIEEDIHPGVSTHDSIPKGSSTIPILSSNISSNHHDIPATLMPELPHEPTFSIAPEAVSRTDARALEQLQTTLSRAASPCVEPFPDVIWNDIPYAGGLNLNLRNGVNEAGISLSHIERSQDGPLGAPGADALESDVQMAEGVLSSEIPLHADIEMDLECLMPDPPTGNDTVFLKDMIDEVAELNHGDPSSPLIDPTQEYDESELSDAPSSNDASDRYEETESASSSSEGPDVSKPAAGGKSRRSKRSSGAKQSGSKPLAGSKRGNLKTKAGGKQNSSKSPPGGKRGDSKTAAGDKSGGSKSRADAKSNNSTSSMPTDLKPPTGAEAGAGSNLPAAGKAVIVGTSILGQKRSLEFLGNTEDNPIDVDKYMSIFEPRVVREYVDNKQITLDYSKARSLVRHKASFKAYDFNGTATTFTPAAHYRSFLKCFATFMARAEADYIKEQPKFLSSPATSCLASIQYSNYNSLDAISKQKLFEGKSAVVVQNWPVDPNLKFDEAGLRTVAACLASPADLLDYSLPDAGKQCSPILLTGKVQDLLENAKEGGKILNGLDFPKWNGNLEPNDLAVDIDAWEYTRGIHFLDERGAAYPTADMNWNLAGLANATTNIHIDSDGTFTKNLVGCGKKGWGFLKDTESIKVSSTEFFIEDHFRLYKYQEGCQYGVEFVVLNPGDMLLMKPGVPHFVITLEHSICYGGHLYCTNTMQQTLVSLIHAFVLDRHLSNATHHPSRLILRRILFFYHVGLVDQLVSKDEPIAKHLPDIKSIDGILNLLSVCILVVLGNVLDFRTYCAPNQYDDTQADEQLRALLKGVDLNTIPVNERKAIRYARGVALHVMNWIQACCTIKFGDQVIDDLPSQFLVQIANSLWHYKKLADNRALDGAPHCTVAGMRRQITNLFESNEKLRKMWNRRSKFPSDSLELADKDKYTVEWDEAMMQKWKGSSRNFLSDGTTGFDQCFADGHKKWLQYQAHVVIPEMAVISRPVKKRKQS